MALAASYPALVEKIILFAPVGVKGWEICKLDANG